MSITQLVWLRNDIRLTDHPALYQAQQQGQIAMVVCLTPDQWHQHNESEAKCALRVQLINQLHNEAQKLQIPLHILRLNTFSDCPEALLNLCRTSGYKQIWWQNELPIDEAQRDKNVQHIMEENGVSCQRLAPDLIVAMPVLNQQQQPFKVFTPFYKRWLQQLETHFHSPFPQPKEQNFYQESSLEKLDSRNYREDIWPADYSIIREKLWYFCHNKEEAYGQDRDFPALPGTSLLSPYLALGALGPRECLEAIIYTTGQRQQSWQESIWLKELAWRDFYKQLIGHFPHLSMSLPFKAETQHVPWKRDEASFQAWADGQTGFPIVDAAMRQLKQTGWMHNRLRMISASFLTKLLLTDWRKGETFFMRHLIDGEFAANNGGWQWSASTGCDAAPYFRIFNPTRQSEKFDPNGDFIRKFIPELSNVSSRDIHNPPTDIRQQTGYPTPIIDYKQARIEAIAAFENLPKKRPLHDVASEAKTRQNQTKKRSL